MTCRVIQLFGPDCLSVCHPGVVAGTLGAQPRPERLQGLRVRRWRSARQPVSGAVAAEISKIGSRPGALMHIFTSDIQKSKQSAERPALITSSELN